MSQFSSETAYYADAFRRRVLNGMALALMVPSVGFIGSGTMSTEQSLVDLGIVFAIILGPFALMLYGFGRYTKIVLSAQGIRLRDVGRSAAVPWSNIERIHRSRTSAGLVLCCPSTEKWAEKQLGYANFSYAGASFYDDETRQLMGEKRLLDLRAFRNVLQSNALIAQAHLHAPDLVIAIDLAVQQHSAPERKLTYAILAIVIVLAGLGVAMGYSM